MIRWAGERPTSVLSSSSHNSVLNLQAGAGSFKGLCSETSYPARALCAPKYRWGGIRFPGLVGKADLYNAGRPGRTPRASKAWSSTLPSAAAERIPRASSKLLFPLPLAPMKTLTSPRSTLTSSRDLKVLTDRLSSIRHNPPASAGHLSRGPTRASSGRFDEIGSPDQPMPLLAARGAPGSATSAFAGVRRVLDRAARQRDGADHDVRNTRRPALPVVQHQVEHRLARILHEKKAFWLLDRL